LEGISPAVILQNRQSAINATLPSKAMHEGQEGDDLVAAFVRWAAGQRTASAAASRARERSLREQAAASATWAGVIVDLAEQQASVTVAVGGQKRAGRVVGAGRNFFVLDGGRHGRITLVALDAVGAIWPDQVADVLPTGARLGAIDMTLMMALALLVEQRAPVCITSPAGLQTSGELVAAGEDVLTLRIDPAARRLTYVPLATVALCELR
jgi:hypothetical protein